MSTCPTCGQALPKPVDLSHIESQIDALRGQDAETRAAAAIELNAALKRLNGNQSIYTQGVPVLPEIRRVKNRVFRELLGVDLP